MYIFIILILILIIGIIENKLHLKKRKQIPIIIHVNGTRGKSTITRMITYGLLNSGLKAWGKTTGSKPTLLKSDGEEIVLQRRGQPRVKEQLKIISKAAREEIDILVLECMAISPEIQFIAGNRIVKPNYSVISNILKDHEEIMGSSLHKIRDNLVLSIPSNGNLITTSQVKEDFFQDENYDYDITTAEEKREHITLAGKYSYPNFKDNIAITLKIADILGLNKDEFIEGMLKAPADPGVTGDLKITYNKKKIYFSNAFSGNDETSTLKLWEKIPVECKNEAVVVGLLNIRNDRPIRTKKMLELYQNNLSKEIDYLYIIGIGKVPEKKYSDKNVIRINSEGKVKVLLNHITNNIKTENILIFGFGNYMGIAEKLIDYFKEEGKSCYV